MTYRSKITYVALSYVPVLGAGYFGVDQAVPLLFAYFAGCATALLIWILSEGQE